jgi:hypothetical protein
MVGTRGRPETLKPLLPGFMQTARMPRYEVAVASPFGWSTGSSVADEVQSVAVIEFEGRRFVWHSPEAANPQYLPVVSVLVADGNDYAAEQLLTNRFLSAVCYVLDQPLSIVVSSAAGYKHELDAPLLRQPGNAPMLLVTPPSRIVVASDERLRLVLALFREGRAAESPFYRFLALYNALDASFDNREHQRDEFIRACTLEEPVPERQAPETFDWATYLRDGLRNAVAHAVRPPGKPLLDPDDLLDRSDLDRASRTLSHLVRLRVSQRWREGVQSH